MSGPIHVEVQSPDVEALIKENAALKARVEELDRDKQWLLRWVLKVVRFTQFGPYTEERMLAVTANGKEILSKYSIPVPTSEAGSK
jgi:hypothetical protein